MSGKLDQSLEDIVMTEGGRNKAKALRRGRVAKTKARATVTPAGGISKKNKTSKPQKKGTASALDSISVNPGARGATKIVVTGLPADVNETLVKEFFKQQVGSVHHVNVSYNSNGQSRGVATVFFTNVESAAKAVEKTNGVMIDGTRKLKVELIIAPEVKSLGDRLTKSSARPKPASKTTKKPGVAPAATAGGKAKSSRREKTARPKRKTADELDAEMTDYFGNVVSASGSTLNGAAPAATVAIGETMDEIQ